MLVLNSARPQVTRAPPQKIWESTGDVAQNQSTTFKMSFFTIPVKLYSLVLMLLLAFVGVMTYTVTTLNKQKQDGRVINLAGKQRMLTQKLSKNIMELQLGNLAKSEEIETIIEDFETVLTGLKDGNEEMNLPPAQTPEILAKLEETEKQWESFAESAGQVANLWPDLQQRLDAITATNVDLSNEASDLLDELKEIADAETLATAGRMSTITQRVAKSVLQFVLYRNEKSLREGEKFMALQNMIIQGLLEGAVGLGLQKIEDPDTREMIGEFQGNWRKFQSQVEVVFKQMPEISEASNYVNENNIPLLKAMNAAVQEMTGHSQAKVASMINTEYTILMVLFIVGLTASFFIIRTITKPLNEVSQKMGSMAEGSLQQENIMITNRDEVGVLGNIFNQLLGSLNKLVGQAKAIAEDRLEDEALKIKVQGDLGEAFTEMNNKMNWFARQATFIADGDLTNKDLHDDSVGTLGDSMSQMVKNLRDAAEKDEKAKKEIEALMAMTKEQAKATEEKAAQEKRTTDELQAKVNSMLVNVEAAAKGDLTQRVTVSGTDSIGQMGIGLSAFLTDLRGNISSIAMMSEKIGSSASDLSEVSETLSANAEETSAQAGVVSSASEQVSSNVNTVATGAEEMTASIKEIANNASEAAKVTAEAVKMAEETNIKVTKLDESSAQIGQVIKVITSIAEQTNLLALNATIEAARAGEAGKGFAVVANEVKELAKETAKATDDIGKKIQTIQTDTKDTAQAIGEITTIIKKVNDFSTTIASAVEEQTATTNEINRNISEMAKGTAEISQNITGVAQAAQSTATGADQTKNSAGEMSGIASEMEKLINRFTYQDDSM